MTCGSRSRTVISGCGLGSDLGSAPPATQWLALGTSWPLFLYYFLHAKSLQSYPTLCDPMDGSPPGSSVHGILQAGILEWVAVPSSGGSSQLRDRACVSFCLGRQVLYHRCHLYFLELH